ncbi:hypothetical protein DdX_19579 [Ditylenchus destructor]|uniref:Protein kinase domain-containing protein n=1 Tax=Ditylenchus destructor TaxID=166010 RepID=A0AAD4QX58_9BILA|nr:hypothetical protein DdX_19579 [Ditylenchus destructor]
MFFYDKIEWQYNSGLIQVYKGNDFKNQKYVIVRAVNGERSDNELRVIKALNEEPNDFVSKLYNSGTSMNWDYWVLEDYMEDFYDLISKKEQKANCDNFVRTWKAVLSIYHYLHSKGVVYGSGAGRRNFVVVNEIKEGKRITLLKAMDFYFSTLNAENHGGNEVGLQKLPYHEGIGYDRFKLSLDDLMHSKDYKMEEENGAPEIKKYPNVVAVTPVQVPKSYLGNVKDFAGWILSCFPGSKNKECHA